MNLLYLLATLFVFIQSVTALGVSKWHRYSEGEFIGQACYWSETNIAVYCSEKFAWGSYECQCMNEASLGAYAICLFEKTSESETMRNQSIKWLQDHCPNYSKEDVYAAYNNATEYVIPQNGPLNATHFYPVPVRYNETLFENALETFKIRYGVFDDGMFFGMGMCGYFAVVILLGTIYRVYKATGLDKTMQVSSRFKFVKWAKSKLMISGLYGKLCKQDHWLGTIPNRLESLVLLGWVLLNFFSVFFHYTSNGDRNVYWPSSYKQITRYISDRTGFIALFLTNLTWMFAGRNNFLIWCTGWKHSTFITYHKWVGRACIFHVILHSVFLAWQSSIMGYLAGRLLKDWYRWGCVATVACSLMAIQASSFFRKLSYEVFFIGHILLAVLFLVGSWKHLAWEDRAYWFLPAIAIWVFDRVLRFVRVFWFGGYVKATISMHEKDEVLTVSIPSYNKRFYKFSAGQYCYLYLADMDSDWYLLWQSHPFTIVSTDNGVLKFFIKAKKGITAKIFKNMVAKGVTTRNIRVAVEGPYGSTNWSIKRTDHALLYSSSTGNAAPYMYAKELLERNEKAQVKFYWSIQNLHSMEWFAEELQRLCEYKNNIQVIVYITREVADTEMAKNAANIDFPNIDIRYGRMTPSEVVGQDIAECGEKAGISVVCCGHPQLCDDIRQVVKSKVLENYSIDFHDDLQKW